MLFSLAPNMIIIIGPSATLGIELSIVRNGSNILNRYLDRYKIIEIIMLKIILSINETKVSFIVVLICRNKLFSLYKFKTQLNIFVGEEKTNELIILYLDSNSHNIRNTIMIRNLIK